MLQIALRRLRDEPIGLLATLRKAPELGEPFELERSFPDGRLERISLGPLSLGAVHRLLEERLGLDLTRPELARVQEATAGNPFFALELGRELVRTNTRPAPGRALRDARELAASCSAAGSPGCPARPSTSCSRSQRSPGRRSSWSRRRTETASVSLEALEAAVHEGSGRARRLARSLRAPAARLDLSTSRRRSGSAAPCTGRSPERSRTSRSAPATWRSPQTAPTLVVASELDAAAEQAAARGAPGAAAELSELAAELTPDDPALARKRRFRAASLHRLAGDGEQAVARCFEQLLEEVPPGVERATSLSSSL